MATYKAFKIILKSRNAKTGVIPVSMSTASTCPDACPFKGHGCYGDYGHTLIQWRRITEAEKEQGPLAYERSYTELMHAISALPEDQIWRHNEAGDLVGCENEIDVAHARRLVAANGRRKGFTYTHYPVLATEDIPKAVAALNRRIIEQMNECGFTVNVSANSPAHADAIIDSGIKAPVVTVLPADAKPGYRTPAGRLVTICPAVLRKGEVTCKSCGICQRQRENIIGFPAHGSGKKLLSPILEKNVSGRLDKVASGC